MKKMKKLHLLLTALLLTLLIPVCNLSTTKAATLKAPKTLTVKQGRNNISLRWSKVSGAKGYVVYRKNSPSQSWKRLKVVKAPTLKYLDKSISSGKNYYYTVRPYTTKSGKNSYGTYNKSGKNVIYLKEPKVTATKSYKSVTLKWNKTTGAAGYEVYRKSGSSGYSKLKTTTGLSYTDKSVKPSTNYTYAVRAYKKSGSATFRSLYYDGANLVSVKTNKEPVVTPEPDKPDINDAVESKVYFNENGRNIIEISNKSNFTYYNVRYKIDFYDNNGALIWRISESSISTILEPNTLDYGLFRTSNKIDYSYYKIKLSEGINIDNNLSLVMIGELYDDGFIALPVTNLCNEVVSVIIRVVVFNKGIPNSVSTHFIRLNVKESNKIRLPISSEALNNSDISIKIIVDSVNVLL